MADSKSEKDLKIELKCAIMELSLSERTELLKKWKEIKNGGAK